MEFTPDFNLNNPYDQPDQHKDNYTTIKFNDKYYEVKTEDYQLAMQEGRTCVYILPDKVVEFITPEDLKAKQLVIRLQNKIVSKNHHRNYHRR